MQAEHVLEVRDLCVQFSTQDSTINAVNGLSFTLDKGQTLGIVGESGSGKSQSMLAVMGLLARNGQARGEVHYRGRNLLGLPSAELNRIRGNRIAMVFQDAMAALNPYLTVERQLTEVLQCHRGMDRRSARAQALRMLDAVKIPEAQRRMGMYPHEFSGGMRQRVMIAMALLCEPEVLIADEPTTALDVTVQAQTIALLRELQRDLGTAIVMITHDLGVVAGLCDQVLVLYGGRVMEQGSASQLFHHSSHPYTVGLLQAVPRMDLDEEMQPLQAIPGEPLLVTQHTQGCPFAPRCPLAFDPCHRTMPPLQAHGDEAQIPIQRPLRACHANIDAVHALQRQGARHA